MNINEPFSECPDTVNECRREEREHGVERAGATERRIGSEWFDGVSCSSFPQSPWLLRKLNSVVLTEFKAKKSERGLYKTDCLHKHRPYISSPLWTIKSHRTQAENNFLFLEPKGKTISEHLSSIMSTFPVMRKLQRVHFLFM